MVTFLTLYVQFFEKNGFSNYVQNYLDFGLKTTFINEPSWNKVATDKDILICNDFVPLQATLTSILWKWCLGKFNELISYVLSSVSSFYDLYKIWFLDMIHNILEHATVHPLWSLQRNLICTQRSSLLHTKIIFGSYKFSPILS
jgi:hypothetical protein